MKKNNFTTLLLFVLFAFLFLSKADIYSQQEKFILGFSGTYPKFHSPAGYADMNLYVDWAGYRDLNLNVWQGWGMGDGQTDVLAYLDSSNLDSYFQPDSIMWMAMGRISIHQAEDNSSIPFRYDNHHNRGSNFTETWQGESVTGRKYTVIPQEAGTLVPVLSGVKENAEYSYSGVPGDPVYQYDFWRDSVIGRNPVNNFLHIKPRMRISTTDAFANPPKRVARIYVLNHDSDTVRYFDIDTRDFRHDDEFTYDGRYLEDYFERPDIVVRLDSLNIGREAHSIEWTYKYECKVDFQVHWYGEVDLWIDYMKVMDEPAHNLFHPDPSIREFYQRVIIRKAKKLLNHPQGGGVRGFYTEETEYTRLRCLELINKLLRDSTNNDPRESG